MIPDRSPTQVTIEDLLRVKRAERPSAEFWMRFEQDLRAKQLAAIVEKRPWWHCLHFARVARLILQHQVPVGAAAILAFSFIVVGQYRSVTALPTRLAPEVVTPIAQAAVTTPIVPEIATLPNIISAVPKSEMLEASVAPKVASSTHTQPAITISSTALSSRPYELTAMIPWGVPEVSEAESADQLLTTDFQNDGASGLSDASLLRKLRSDENHVEAKPAVAQASSPRELRRAKILTGMVLADTTEGSDNVRVIHGRDLAANDLSEAQLYDSARRLGVGGDRFTLKF